MNTIDHPQQIRKTDKSVKLMNAANLFDQAVNRLHEALQELYDDWPQTFGPDAQDICGITRKFSIGLRDEAQRFRAREAGERISRKKVVR